MIEKLFAAVVLAICVAWFARLLVGPRHRARMDAAVKRGARRSAQAARALWHRRSARRAATQAADEAIRRARGERDGNVYRPKSFKRPPHKLH